LFKNDTSTIRPGIVNVPGRTPVVISNSQLAVISAAAKACTFHVVVFRERTIIGSFRNRYLVYHIESYRLLLYQGKTDITCITEGSVAVNRSHYTRQSNGIRAPSPDTRRLIVHDVGRGWRHGRRKETVTLYHDTKMAQYWVLATSDRWCHTPSTSRKWWQ